MKMDRSLLCGMSSGAVEGFQAGGVWGDAIDLSFRKTVLAATDRRLLHPS